MAIAPVSNAEVVGFTGGTTGAINTTGASLLVAHLIIDDSSSGHALTDSKGNTWTPLAEIAPGDQSKVRLFYVANPTVGTGHTFTGNSSCIAMALFVQAFSGVKTTSPFDQQSGNSDSSVASIQPGTVTPSEDNELVVFGVAINGSFSGLSINGGFTISDQENFGSGNNYGGALAYLVQGAAAAANPTASWSGGSYKTRAVIATFRAADSTATEYTLTGPSSGAINVASTNFTLTPNGEFTGTITPSDSGAGGTFTPSSRTWSATSDAKTFTYTPVSLGTKTISASDNGGLTDPSSLNYAVGTGVVAVAASDLWYNGYDGLGTPDQSCFAELRITTNATVLKVTGTNTMHAVLPAWDEIVVVVDGTLETVQEFAADGQETFTYNLAGGTKNIVVRNSIQDSSSGLLGTFIDSFQLEGVSSYSVTAPNNTNRIVIYGDSIAVGANSTTPATQGWTMLLRDTYSQPIMVEAWGFRALHDDGDDGTARQALADRIAGYNPGKIYLVIGNNDYTRNLWTAANFGTAYADLLDKFHTESPSARIYAQSPTIRTIETANGLGSTMPEYRTAIFDACSSRAWATFVDGTDILEVGDLADSAHPTTAGHAIYAAYVDEILSAPITTRRGLAGGMQMLSGGIS